MKNKSSKFIIVLLLLIAIFSIFFLFKTNNTEQEIADEPSQEVVEETNEDEEADEQEEIAEYIDYYFRSSKLLNQHYDKHGKEMGFKSAKEYEKAASDVVNNQNVLHKLEKEDNDDVYYLEETNEFVIVSKDGYIRTYFYPDAGKAYFDRQ